MSRVLKMCMKDEITIGLNGKTIASFGIELKGRGINVKSIGSFVVSTGSDEGNDILNIRMGCVLETVIEEKKVTPIEPMVIRPIVVEKKLLTFEEMMTTPLFVPAAEEQKVPTYNEIPIKTGRKPRGPNKPKEPVVEESVFDKPVEVVAPSTPITSTVVSHTPITSVGGSVLSPMPTLPPTPVRINELAKLIKMWCKAAQYKIEDVTIEVLNAHGASDIIENDSPETVNAGIKEAARLMKG
jgi:hypothetical protein